ncbi:MAG: glycosyltransferase family 9 protein [Gammaproteobacteria bacterium]|nr:glycosyltransferase family 9 protein [Gammaproteobacteria bacterium]
MLRKPRKFLIFAKPAIGDILLATPLMRSIRSAEPDAVIDVMCYPGQEGILEGNPDIDHVVPIKQKPSARELLQLLRRMFRKYDVAITNAADDRVHLYLLFFGKERISVTLKGGPAWKRWIVAGSVQDDPESLHALLRNNNLGNILGFDSNYEIRVPEAKDSRTERPVPPGTAGHDDAYAVIHPDARLPYKRWTQHGWLDVMQYLDSCGLKTYITGGNSSTELEYVRGLMQQVPKSVLSLAGQLRFAEVGDLIRKCRIYIGIDTVNSHLAAATGAPTIALFGPESPVRWGPWPKNYAVDRSPWQSTGTQRVNNVLIIQTKNQCAECRQGDCRRRHHRGIDCPLMTGISSEQVIRGIREMLQ